MLLTPTPLLSWKWTSAVYVTGYELQNKFQNGDGLFSLFFCCAGYIIVMIKFYFFTFLEIIILQYFTLFPLLCWQANHLPNQKHIAKKYSTNPSCFSWRGNNNNYCLPFHFPLHDLQSKPKFTTCSRQVDFLRLYFINPHHHSMEEVLLFNSKWKILIAIWESLKIIHFLTWGFIWKPL